MAAQRVSRHHFRNMVRNKQYFQKVKGETQDLDSVGISFGTAVLMVEMIM